MPLTISEDVLRAARMTEEELRLEIAVSLFEKERLILGSASRLAGMGQLDFQRVLAGRKIPLHYGVADFEEDIQTLTRLGRL